jgi:hypothetical protein
MSYQTDLNQKAETLASALPGIPSDSNPILTYLATLFEESLVGKMSPYGFLSSTSWWPTE